jgi:serine/threonine protein kinase
MPQTLIDDRYALGNLLGSGGMAEVCLAHDEVLDRQVALKILKNQYAENGEFVERFRREASSAAALNHPNIVSVYDRGSLAEDGTYYIVMEYIPGGTLKERILREGPLDPGTVAELGSEVARALGAAHEKGVIHRDVKPQNILLTDTGDAKVTDFGIARAANATTTSQPNLVLGTAGYMSPEQTKGEPVGPQSDLYSLGVVLYEMLTGELPYSAEDPVALAMKHVNESPPSPREAKPEVPEALDTLTMKLLAKKPEDRYASAAELADDLERVRSGLPPTAAASEKTTEQMTAPLPPNPGGGTRKTTVQPPVTPTPMKKVPIHGRGRWGRLLPVLAALLLGLALLGGLAWTLTQDIFGVASVEVPSLEALTQEEAQERLDESGLALGEVDEAPSDSAAEGTVIEQDPQAGASVDPETSVNVTLSSGPELVSIPDLAGLGVAEAELALAEENLKLGRQDEAPSEVVTIGTVIEQEPVGGTEVEEGTAVDIVVSTGPQQAPFVQAAPAVTPPTVTPPAVTPPAYDEKAAKKVPEEQKNAAKKADEEQKKPLGTAATIALTIFWVVGALCVFYLVAMFLMLSTTDW